ncbi:hypothetical protein [Grimontia sedimenti]|uniref:hypothetical protein n=1 Tax=Grimontia sedimenti TaxID=2711294 RepID=UPI00197AA14E|nr:hypothetical protein [Grimontia sedimenti]
MPIAALSKTVQLQAPNHNQSVDTAKEDNNDGEKRGVKGAVRICCIGGCGKKEAKKNRPLESARPFSEMVAENSVYLVWKRLCVVHFSVAICLSSLLA